MSKRTMPLIATSRFEENQNEREWGAAADK
jgi:hypothetical protein